MSTYKITNITNLAGKRDFKFNSELDIDYIDNMVKKTVKLKPNESLYLTVESIPLSIHRLRVKNLIDVSAVSQEELDALLEVNKPKGAPKQVKKAEDTEETPKKSTRKKK